MRFIERDKDFRYKVFLDTEFTGLKQDAELISVGLISQNNRTFYAEFNDFDRNVDEWVQENVIKNLCYGPPGEGEQDHYSKNKSFEGYPVTQFWNIEMRGNKKTIGENLYDWLNSFHNIEIWSDVLAYDWVLFSGLLGTRLEYGKDFPKCLYYIPFDISTLMKDREIDPDINREEFAELDDVCTMFLKDKKHNALWDALVIKKCYNKLWNME